MDPINNNNHNHNHNHNHQHSQHSSQPGLPLSAQIHNHHYYHQQQQQQQQQQANHFLHRHQCQQQQQQQLQYSFSAFNPLPSSSVVLSYASSSIVPTGTVLPAAALSAPAQLLPPPAEDHLSLRSSGVGVPAGDDRKWPCAPCRQRKQKCDGVRPFCGYCARKGLSLACSYVGLQPEPEDHPAADAANDAGGLGWEAKLAKVDPSWHVTPSTLTEMLLKASLQQNLFSPAHYPDVDDARPDVDAARLPARPGADPNELDALTTAYFRRCTGLIEVMHRHSFLMDRAGAPAFLQAAICAMGAADASLMTRPKSVALHYYEFARSRALDACDSPSLENMQALLILAELSIQLGRFSVGRLLFSFAGRMTQILELDTDPDDLPRSFSPVEKETRRRCWWMCYFLESYVAAISHQPSPPNRSTVMKPICLDEVWRSNEPSAVALIAPLAPDSSFDAYIKSHNVYVSTIRACAKLSSAPTLFEPDLQRLLECGDAHDQFRMTLPDNISVDKDRIADWLTPDTDGTGLPSVVRWRICVFCTYHSSTLLLTNRHLLKLHPRGYAVLPRADRDEGVDLRSLQLAVERGIDAAAAIVALVARMNDLAIHCPNLAVLPVFLTAHFLVILDAATAALPSLSPPPPPTRRRSRSRDAAAAAAAAAAGNPQQRPPPPPAPTRETPRALLAHIVTHFRLARTVRPSLCVGFRAFSGRCDLGWPGMAAFIATTPLAPAEAAAATPQSTANSDDDDEGGGDDDGDGTSLLDTAVASWLQAPEMTTRFVGALAFAPLWRAVCGVVGQGGEKGRGEGREGDDGGKDGGKDAGEGAEGAAEAGA
ncbi:fungal-specific transcription factor domain-containing protein [Zopfochytrium polystomum]|nr:fungal-specific transcription factor domain-containing protein [Zopfochytrium polystomum]